MTRSASRRSTIRSGAERRRAARRAVDVYLMPAVVGGGRGDVEEVLGVGRALARTGYAPVVPRVGPRAVLPDRSFDWSGIRPTRRVVRRAPRAVTISSQFGVTAAQGRDEPLGRAGPWADARAAVDRAYGPGQVLHLSLEEFARARPVAALAEERWRESGRTERDRRARRRSREFRREVEAFAALYRKFRAFDRPDVLAVFPTFRRSARFASQFPESVQVGPLWPEPRRRPRRTPGPVRVLWYASPSTSERLAPRLLAGLSESGRPVRLVVRSPWPLPLRPSATVRVVVARTRRREAWNREWDRTDLAIVTGTRSLLEAIRWGVPFLYFNGVMGRGRSTRRHRPEKLLGLLDVLRASGVPASVRRDLADVARLRNVEEGVARWVLRPRGIGARLRAEIARGFPPPFEDAARFVVAAVGRFGAGSERAGDLVAALRRESRARRPSRGGAPSKA